MTAYQCITADPPWAERGGCGRGADDHYDVIDRRSDILRVMVTAPCWRPADDCHLWMWTTMTSLVDALWLVDALGFRYVTHGVWVKLNQQPDLLAGQMNPALGIGQYLRGSHEPYLLAVRGNGFAVRTEAMDVPSVILAPVPRDAGGKRIHSRKPPEFRAMVERRSRGPRLEMFSRERQPGWDAWGNELPEAA